MPRPAKCSLCYWSGQCYEDGGCEFFTSLDLNYYDDDCFIEELIEDERADFHQYWHDVNREFEDELFF